jgi:hypothetical protein
MYFILWVIIQYCCINLLLKLLQLWLLGALSVGCCVLLTHSHKKVGSFFFELFLTFWHYKMFQICFIYSLLWS